jgi:hypothetical protein
VSGRRGPGDELLARLWELVEEKGLAPGTAVFVAGLTIDEARAWARPLAVAIGRRHLDEVAQARERDGRA